MTTLATTTEGTESPKASPQALSKVLRERLSEKEAKRQESILHKKPHRADLLRVLVGLRTELESLESAILSSTKEVDTKTGLEPETERWVCNRATRLRTLLRRGVIKPFDRKVFVLGMRSPSGGGGSLSPVVYWVQSADTRHAETFLLDYFKKRGKPNAVFAPPFQTFASEVEYVTTFEQKLRPVYGQCTSHYVTHLASTTQLKLTIDAAMLKPNGFGRSLFQNDPKFG